MSADIPIENKPTEEKQIPLSKRITKQLQGHINGHEFHVFMSGERVDLICKALVCYERHQAMLKRKRERHKK